MVMLKDSAHAYCEICCEWESKIQSKRIAELLALAYEGDIHYPSHTYKTRLEETKEELDTVKDAGRAMEIERNTANDLAEKAVEEANGLRRERDELKAEVERLQKEPMHPAHLYRDHITKLLAEIAKLQAVEKVARFIFPMNSRRWPETLRDALAEYAAIPDKEPAHD